MKEPKVLVGVPAFIHELCKCGNKVVDIKGFVIAQGRHMLLAFMFSVVVIMRLRWVNSPVSAG